MHSTANLYGTFFPDATCLLSLCRMSRFFVAAGAYAALMFCLTIVYRVGRLNVAEYIVVLVSRNLPRCLCLVPFPPLVG